MLGLLFSCSGFSGFTDYYRVKLRDDLAGIPTLVNLLDSVLYGFLSEQQSAKKVGPLLEQEEAHTQSQVRKLSLGSSGNYD